MSYPEVIPFLRGRLGKNTAGLKQADIARKLKVTPAAVCQWHAAWEEEGKEGLKSKGCPGRNPWLTDKDIHKIEKALIKGPLAFGYETDLWTCTKGLNHLFPQNLSWMGRVKRPAHSSRVIGFNHRSPSKREKPWSALTKVASHSKASAASQPSTMVSPRRS
jgi:hypothetical protein